MSSKARLASSRKIMVLDVGANKGYFTEEVLSLLNNQIYGNLQGSIIRNLARRGCRGDARCCGVCRDCWEKRSSVLSLAPTRYEFILFEALRANYLHLETVFQEHANVHVNNLAVSNISGQGHFPRLALGAEKGSLDSTENPNTELDSVSIVSLDDYFGKDKTLHIDVVKIDTEGYDFQVLEGSGQLLREKRISAVTFEYGDRNKGKSLEELIFWLAKLNYFCFFEGKGLIHPITTCYHRTMSDLPWGNICCGLGGSLALNSMLNHVVKYPHDGSVSCPVPPLMRTRKGKKGSKTQKQM